MGRCGDELICSSSEEDKNNIRNESCLCCKRNDLVGVESGLNGREGWWVNLDVRCKWINSAN